MYITMKFNAFIYDLWNGHFENNIWLYNFGDHIPVHCFAVFQPAYSFNNDPYPTQSGKLIYNKD